MRLAEQDHLVDDAYKVAWNVVTERTFVLFIYLSQ